MILHLATFFCSASNNNFTYRNHSKQKRQLNWTNWSLGFNTDQISTKNRSLVGFNSKDFFEITTTIDCQIRCSYEGERQKSRNQVPRQTNSTEKGFDSAVEGDGVAAAMDETLLRTRAVDDEARRVALVVVVRFGNGLAVNGLRILPNFGSMEVQCRRRPLMSLLWSSPPLALSPLDLNGLMVSPVSVMNEESDLRC